MLELAQVRLPSHPEMNNISLLLRWLEVNKNNQFNNKKHWIIKKIVFGSDLEAVLYLEYLYRTINWPWQVLNDLDYWPWMTSKQIWATYKIWFIVNLSWVWRTELIYKCYHPATKSAFFCRYSIILCCSSWCKESVCNRG